MPEIKNTFVKSSMNKDLDARLLPNGVYRDAKNISISRSEGSDVGALENVLGNRKLTSLRTNIGYLEDAKNTAKYYAVSGDVVLNGLDVIGYHVDVANDRIFLFLTDYIDSSNDQLSNFAPGDIITTNTNYQVTVRAGASHVLFQAENVAIGEEDTTPAYGTLEDITSVQVRPAATTDVQVEICAGLG